MTPPSLRHLIRSTAVISCAAAMSAGSVLGLGVGSAGAATASSGVVRAYPVRIGGSGPAALVDLLVPYATGLTGGEAATDAAAALVAADFSRRSLTGPEVRNLSCSSDIADEECRDPFSPLLIAAQGSPGWDRSATFERPNTDADSVPTARLAATIGSDRRSLSEASSPGGALGGYLSFQAATARGETRLDDAGRVITVARSELSGVVIGAKGEIRADKLRSVASSGWTGSEAARDPRVSVEVEGLVILDQPVELTPQGLRLRQGAPSEQEAYDGARVLLDELASRGIVVEVPTWGVERSGGEIVARAQGFKVRFEQGVGGGPVEATRVAYELELGHSSASVVPGVLARPRPEDSSAPDVFAAELERRGPESSSAQPTPAGGVERPAGGRRPGAAAPESASPGSAPTGTVPAEPPSPPSEPSTSQSPSDLARPADALPQPTEVAAPPLSPRPSIESRRAARSVAGAFGAFLGLALVLPLARLVIRRLA